MKKHLFLSLILVSLLILVSCNAAYSNDTDSLNTDTLATTRSIAKDTTNDGQVTDNTQVTDNNTTTPYIGDTNTTGATDNSNNIGGDNYLTRLYIDEVNDIDSKLVVLINEDVNTGWKMIEEWLENVYRKLSKEERNQSPVIYELFKYFPIKKEDVIKLNEKAKSEGKYPLFSDSTIDALFCGDVNKMKEALVNDFSFYFNGKVYNWYYLDKEVGGRLLQEGLSKEKFKDYVTSASEKLESEHLLYTDKMNELLALVE